MAMDVPNGEYPRVETDGMPAQEGTAQMVYPDGGNCNVSLSARARCGVRMAEVNSQTRLSRIHFG
jgi:hypothetical protein